jgi:hypothetical protein
MADIPIVTVSTNEAEGTVTAKVFGPEGQLDREIVKYLSEEELASRMSTILREVYELALRELGY